MNAIGNKLFSILLISISLLLASVTYTIPLAFPSASKEVFTTAAIALLIICMLYIGFIVVKGRIANKKNRDILTHMLESVGAMVIILDKHFNCTSVNTTFSERTGYSAEDIMDYDAIKSHLVEQRPGVVGLARENGEANDIPLEIICKDGTILPSTWNLSSMHTGGRRFFIAVGVDTTKDYEMQKKLYAFSKDLAEIESRHSLSMELSEIGLLLRKEYGDNFFISEQLQNMLGIHDDFVQMSVLRELVHPKDRLLFDAFCRFDTSDMDIAVHNVEMRVISKDGEYRWYSFRYRMSEDENGITTLGGAVIDITREKEKDTLIERMAFIDDVTQIFNRNKFMEIGQETFDCSVGLGYSYWLIVLDIDKFHIINDTCGYKNGNILLKKIADIVIMNITQAGFGARMGGDNFAVLIRDDGNESLPVKTIKAIQHDISLLSSDIFSSQTITCSAGYCKMPEDAEDFAKAIDHAEFALSLTDDSRGAIIRYSGKMHDSILADNSIEKELNNALENNELVLYYQPKIDLMNGDILGMEALIRWKKPNGQIVPPSVFIPVAEQSMLITKISSFVLREACRQNKLWQDKGMPKIAVSVNLTSTDFYQTDVTEEMRRVLSETGLEAKYLEIELTESLALKDIEQAVRQMQEIKSLGVKLSMDDFGTGYSSLSYIQILPITLLKLDRSFVMYLEDDEVSREIVSAVIRIAKSKKIETIAEGIETSGQAEILKNSGCDMAQGFFFGKPMPADEFEKYVLEKTSVKI